MKHIKKFKESKNHWIDIEKSLDVYQLYDLLVFKYGNIFKDSLESIDSEEDDYNPDYIYDIIKYELESHNLLEDFLNNYEKYIIEKDEKDPMHWRYRKKIQDGISKNWDLE